MSFLKKAFDFYLNSSIHVGLAVWCLVKITDYEASDYALLVFFGTIVGYNFLKYSHLFYYSTFQIFKIQKILFLSFFAFCIFIYLYFNQKSVIQIQIGMAGLLVFLYPFVRKIGWIKILFVSFVISFVTIYIPYKYNNLEIMFLHRFLVVFVLMIPFEIVDINVDPIHLKTLPQIIGIIETKIIGYIILMLLNIVVFLNKNNINIDVYIYNLVSIMLFAAIYFSTRCKTKYYSSFWVESIPIIWFLLLL